MCVVAAGSAGVRNQGKADSKSFLKSISKMPKRKGIQSSEELREDLQCPVCLVIPRSAPIYQCEDGHIHCKKCHPGLQECPICRGRIGNTRSLMTEKIIAKLPTKCAFAEYGCLEEEKLPQEMLNHEQNCIFRLMKCKCKEDVPVSDFADHCIMKHGSKVTDVVKEHSIEYKGVYSDQRDSSELSFSTTPSFIRSKKHTFAFNLRGDNQGYVSFYVFIIGTTADIQNEEYQCKMTITPRGNSKMPVKEIILLYFAYFDILFYTIY